VGRSPSPTEPIRLAPLALGRSADRLDTAGRLRARLERFGRPLGGNDLLIAAQVVALGYAIVTDNEREFARIDELPCENWLHRA
jgi:tRNA(fMet)-specific endonuclease VapC